MKQFVTLRVSVGALLAILLILVLLVVGVVLHRNYAFHNLFFSTFHVDSIQSVTVLPEDTPQKAALTPEETEELVALIRNIRFREEPYKNVKVSGAVGGYEITFKNGICFSMEILHLDRGLITIGKDSYPVADFGDPDAPETKNFLALEALYSRLAE